MFVATTAPQDALLFQLLPIVTKACEILRAEYRQYCTGGAFDIEHKADHSPVTQADVKVNQYLIDALAEISDFPVLSEEGENNTQRQAWKTFWLLDPLDGTKEFLHQRPQFTMNLSLVEGMHTTFAVLAVPVEHCFYICLKQGLPLKYDYHLNQWWIYTPDAMQTHVQVGLSHSGQQKVQYVDYLTALEQITPYSIFKSGSAYKFCMMLEDRVDIYPRFHPTCEWDTSAGQCLLERIGGGLIDFRGRAFVYNQRDTLLNTGFIAYKNAKMKEFALAALGRMSNTY